MLARRSHASRLGATVCIEVLSVDTFPRIKSAVLRVMLPIAAVTARQAGHNVYTYIYI